MSAFEYVIGFYALLLGLAVANVAVGVADMWRDQDRVAIGWCPPLLGFGVILAAMNTWLATWKVHDEVTVDAWQMIAALGICLPYVFVSRAMTPPEDSKIGLEEHYLKSRIAILVALALPPLFALWSRVRLDHFRYTEVEDLWLIGRVLVPAALAFFPARSAQRTGLVALDLWLLAGLFR